MTTSQGEPDQWVEHTLHSLLRPWCRTGVFGVLSRPSATKPFAMEPFINVFHSFLHPPSSSIKLISTLPLSQPLLQALHSLQYRNSSATHKIPLLVQPPHPLTPLNIQLIHLPMLLPQPATQWVWNHWHHVPSLAVRPCLITGQDNAVPLVGTAVAPWTAMAVATVVAMATMEPRLPHHHRHASSYHSSHRTHLYHSLCCCPVPSPSNTPIFIPPSPLIFHSAIC
jgi:hypothetical protein